jgi:hypothetical protein
MIRTWVAYLTGTVETGQVWLATHSLEAVEAAGQQATFVLERNEDTRKVRSVARLDTRPVLSALSRAVGTPAFSISQLRFVFVEGEGGVGERERFRKLAGPSDKIRFIDCGSCTEVLRRVVIIKELAKESESNIRIGGVIDRDFLSDTNAAELSLNQGVFVLPLHEVENFFLHPPTLRFLLGQHGRDDLVPLELIRSASDARAGSWIYQQAMATPNAKSLPDISAPAKERVKSLSWQQFEQNSESTIQGVADVSLYSLDDQRKLKGILDISMKMFARKRGEDGLWKVCEGKQVLGEVARSTGFAGVSALVQAAFAAWARDDFEIPEELRVLREYLARL